MVARCGSIHVIGTNRLAPRFIPVVKMQKGRLLDGTGLCAQGDESGHWERRMSSAGVVSEQRSAGGYGSLSA